MNLPIVPQGYLNTLVVEPDLECNIKTRQNYCSEVEKIKKYLFQGNPSFYHVGDDGALFFKGRLVVPRKHNLDSRSDVMKEAHDTPLSIHPGSTKMYQDIRQRYWWPDMKHDIARYVSEVTFAVASRQNIKGLLDFCNHLKFLNGNGTRSRWTSLLDFLDRRKVMMLSLSSSTVSPRLLTFC